MVMASWVDTLTRSQDSPDIIGEFSTRPDKGSSKVGQRRPKQKIIDYGAGVNSSKGKVDNE